MQESDSGDSSLVKAFVFINTVEPGQEKEVAEELKKIEGVKGAWVVYGVHDVVAEVEEVGWEKLKEVINGKIRRLRGVHSTLSTVVVE